MNSLFLKRLLLFLFAILIFSPPHTIAYEVDNYTSANANEAGHYLFSHFPGLSVTQNVQDIYPESYNKIEALDFRSIDVNTLNTIKYIMAARKTIATDLSYIYADLEILKSSINKTPLQQDKLIPLKLEEFFPKQNIVSANLRTNIDLYIDKQISLHTTNKSDYWFKDIIDQAMGIFKIELKIALWRYADYPTVDLKASKLTPRYEQRVQNIAILESKKAVLTMDSEKLFLNLPYFENITSKASSHDFYFFHDIPSYYLYQLIVGKILFKENIIGNTPVDFAREINIVNWGNKDQSDKSFVEAIDFIYHLDERLQTQLIHTSNEHITLVRKTISDSIDLQLENINESFRIFAELPDLDNIGKYTPFLDRSLFYLNNEDFFKHYSFIYDMPYLKGRLFANFKDDSNTFSLFQVNNQHDNLLHFSQNFENEYVNDNTSTWAFALSIASLPFPYARIINPLLLAAGSGYELFMRVLPHFVYSYKLLNMYNAAFNPYQKGENQISLASYKHMLDANKILQSGKQNLSFSVAFMAPLFFASTFKLYHSTQAFTFLGMDEAIAQSSLNWKTFATDYFSSGYAKNASFSKKLVMKDFVKDLIGNRDLKVATLYFATAFSVLAYYDSIDYGSEVKTRPPKNRPIVAALSFEDSQIYQKKHLAAILKDTKYLATSFAKSDLKSNVSIMHHCYSVHQDLKSNWFKLHDGNEIIQLFGDIYFPLNEYKKLSKLPVTEKYQAMAFMIVQTHLVQSYLQADTYKALVQINMTDFIDNYLNNDNQFHASFFKNSMNIFFQQSLILSFPLGIDIEQLKEEALFWATKYASQI